MDFDPKILERFFKGNYSRKDYLEIKSIFFDLEKRSALTHSLEKQWNIFAGEDDYGDNPGYLLDEIHHKIRLEENRGDKIRFLNAFQKVAAILIVPLLLSVLALIYSKDYFRTASDNSGMEETAYAEIQCPLGVRTKFQLPDGTSGFLNSGSRLRYPVRFSGDRSVHVTGEAYFDVTSDQNHPFIVHTPHLNVKVLGTEFNVMAYDDEDKEEIILNRGEVEVLASDGKVIDKLSSNQKLVLHTGKRKCRTLEVEASQYIGWTEGKLIFRNENMQQVAERLGRWYNVNIKIEDEELLKYAFRATFVDESLEEVLKLMALTAPFSYEEQPRKTSSNHTYQRRTIIVKLDHKRLSAFN